MYKEKQFSSLYEEIYQQLARNEKRGVDTPGALVSMRAKADREHEAGNLDPAIDLLLDMKTQLKELYKTHIEGRGKDELKELKDRFRAELEVIRDLGHNAIRQLRDPIKVIQLQMEQCQKNIRDNDYEQCVDTLPELSTNLDRLTEERMPIETQMVIGKAEKELERNKELDLEDFNSEALLIRARDTLEKKEFEEAKELAREAVEICLKARREAGSKRMDIIYEEVESMILEGRDLGLDMDVVEMRLSEINGLMAGEDQENAEKKLEELHKQAEDMIASVMGSQLEKKKEEVISLMQLAQEDRVKIEDIHKTWEDVNERESKGDFKKAVEILKSLEKTINKALEVRKLEEAQDELDMAFEDLDELKDNTGKDYPDLEEILNDALDASSAGDLELINRKLKEFTEVLELQRSSNEKDLYKSKLAKLEERLLGYEGLDIDTTEGKNLLSKGREQIEKGYYGQATDTMTEMRHFMKSDLNAQLKVRAENNISEMDPKLNVLRNSRRDSSQLEYDWKKPA